MHIHIGILHIEVSQKLRLDMLRLPLTLRRKIMAKIMTIKTEKKKKPVGLWVYIAIAVPPALLTLIYYIFQHNSNAMDWISAHISAPIRSALGFYSSLFPLKFFSVAEVLCTAAALWCVYHIATTVVKISRRKNKLKILGKRAYVLGVFALYALCCFNWLWGVGYFESSFAAKNDIEVAGVSVADLTASAQHFLEKANELAPLVTRDSDGHYAEDIDSMIAASDGIYAALEKEFQTLEGIHYPPKKMMYSKVMSRLGFTGFYFALTGESNINAAAPAFLLPATIAHELAHQRGINAEEEANFAGIAACITSGNPVYEYAGYVDGLIHTMNSLYSADYDAWSEIRKGFCFELETDWQDNNEYWAAQKTDEGIGGAVSTFYDGYLKAYGQELGIKSYGACVDLLVSWDRGRLS